MTPPLDTGQLAVFLLQVAVLLSLALALGRLAVRCALPALVGELAAGVLLGPTVLGHLAPWLTRHLFPADPRQGHLLDAFCQTGALLLVALTGAQLNTALLRRRVADAARISLGGLLLPFGSGVATGYLLPHDVVPNGTPRPVFAMFIGVAMCVSAVPVISKILADLDLLHRRTGQLIVTAAVFDDTVGWLALALVSAMATRGSLAGGLVTSLVSIAVTVAVAYVAVRPVARRVLVGWQRVRDPGPTVALTVAVVLGYAALSAGTGLEALFGAFVAGAAVLSLADPERLAPLRTVVMSVLAPVFLATMGLRVDLTALGRPRVLLSGLAVLAVAVSGKFLGAYLGARTGRIGHWESVAIGVGMNARGMVEVVIAMAGLRLGVLDTATFTIVVLVAMVTSLIAPALLTLSMRRVVPDRGGTAWPVQPVPVR